jgi:hypothetical protein
MRDRLYLSRLRAGIFFAAETFVAAVFSGPKEAI